MSAAVGDEAWRRRQRARLRREWLMQGALLLVVLALVAGVAQNVAANLEARQIKSGFGFLRDPAGFNIGELLFDYSASDSYLRAFAVAARSVTHSVLRGADHGLSRTSSRKAYGKILEDWFRTTGDTWTEEAAGRATANLPVSWCMRSSPSVIVLDM